VPSGKAVDAVGASKGADRQVAWTDGTRVFLQRLNSDGSTQQPSIQVATVSPRTAFGDDEEILQNMSIAIGSGRTLVTAPIQIVDRGSYGGANHLWLVDADGTVQELGSSGCGYADEMSAAAAWNGTRFLVAAMCDGAESGIDVGTVSSTGALTWTDRLELPYTDHLLGSAVAVSRLGDSFAVAFSRPGPTGDLDIAVQRYTASGAALGKPITIASGTGDQFAPAIAASGSQYLVTWVQPGNGFDIGARTLSPTATLGLRKVVVNASGDQVHPAIALGTGGSWHLVWTDARSGNNDVYGGHLSSTAALSPTNGRVIAGGSGVQRAPVVAPTLSGQAFVSYIDPSGVKTLALTAATEPTGSATQASFAERMQNCEAMAAGGGQYLAVWDEGGDIRGQRLGLDGSRLGPSITISQAAGNQTCPRVAYGGSKWLVAWADTRNAATGSDIYGAVVSSAGSIAPSGGLAISKAKAAQTKPAVAFNGASFLVGWTDNRNSNPDVYAGRVLPDGTLMDGSGFPVATGAARQTLTSAVSGTTTGMLVWNGDTGRVVGKDKSFRGPEVHLANPVVVFTPLGYTAISLVSADQTHDSVTAAAVGQANGSPITTHDFGTVNDLGVGYAFDFFAAYDGANLNMIWYQTGDYTEGWFTASIDVNSPTGDHPTGTIDLVPTFLASSGPNMSMLLTHTWEHPERISAAVVN
jgi:hypothetical protein